ncbi:MAG: hypothetical protein PHG82_01765 [Candidatus Gracilibacteria bacterium]|nr:hypothetical protein [Candidatus Gracilibacteria bacterium]
MRKIIACILVSSIILTSSSYATYSPTQEENIKLQTIQTKIDSIYKNKGVERIEILKNQINKYIETNRENERTIYFLRIIKNSLVAYIEKDKKEHPQKAVKIKTPEKKVSLAKAIKINPKQNLIDTYGKEISGEITNACIKNYDFIDAIAKEQDFPTELIIAMWKKEHNCNLDNPPNGWGAFQITSRYYNPGKISLEEFKSEIIDFINFSKNKINYYNKDSGKFKKYFGDENIKISHDNFSIRDLRLYGLLYNGIRKSADLETFTFANANLNSDLKSNSDGIVTSVLKVIKWKLK